MDNNDNPFLGIPCRDCHTPTLTLEWRWETAPLGSFSLAGVQTKTTAYRWPWCVCTTCGAESKGKR